MSTLASRLPRTRKKGRRPLQGREANRGIWLARFPHARIFRPGAENVATRGTRSARGCHPCLGYVPLPMSPGRTREIWSGRRDSNPRPRPWQGRALPLSYTRIREAGAAAPTTGRAMPKAGVECNRPLSLPSTIAFWSEVYDGSREENASKHEIRAIAGFRG
jgi:hypothetical protein